MKKLKVGRLVGKDIEYAPEGTKPGGEWMFVGERKEPFKNRYGETVEFHSWHVFNGMITPFYRVVRGDGAEKPAAR